MSRRARRWLGARPRAAPAVALTTALLVLGSVLGAAALRGPAPGGPGRPPALVVPATGHAPAPAARQLSAPASPPPTDLALAGCPPPPRPSTPSVPPWHPAVLVPDDALPAPVPPPPRAASLAPAQGKGMWIWQFARTDGGDPAAVVADAKRAGLRQLWVRVADSQNGFYGAEVLDRLVPLAHRNGIAVIGWGFPYLYDPVGDAQWTIEALDWNVAGSRLDGFSPDIETSSEGVDLSGRRVQLYLSSVRQAEPRRLLVATVFPPTDAEWASYPYGVIAPYVDAFAPMVYWGCEQPVVAAQTALARLGGLAPVHLIGQAYNMADEGGRSSAPSPAEIDAFLTAARQGGALGASFWSWQAIDPGEWAALASFAW